MLLNQIYENASNVFAQDPELRNLLLSTFNQAQEDTSPWSVQNLAGNPGMDSTPTSMANVDPRVVGAPWAAQTEAMGPQTVAPGKADKLLSFRSEPITPADLANLDQMGGYGQPMAPPMPMPQPSAPMPQPSALMPQPSAPMPRPQVAATAPQYGINAPLPANIQAQLPQQSKLGAFLAGLGSSNAVLPAIGGGIQNMENVDAMNMARNQTLRALINRGLDPETAVAAVTNPEMMKALLPSIFGKGTNFGQIGEDMFGNKTFGFIDTANRSVTDTAGNPITGGTSQNQMMGDPNLHGEEYLKSINSPSLAEQIRKYSKGELPIPTGFALKSPYFQRIMQMISQYDPTFDAVNYNARAATRKNFTSGPEARNITSFNTTMQHLGVLEKAINALNNSDYPDVNRLLNNVQPRMGNTKVNSAINNFNIAKNAVVSELTRAFRGTGGNVHDLLEWAKTLDANQPPSVLKEGIKQGLELLHGRIESLADQYKRGMGTTADPLQFLSPKARAEWGRIMGEDVPTGPAILAIQKPSSGKFDPTYFEQGNGAVPVGGQQQPNPAAPDQSNSVQSTSETAPQGDKAPSPADYGEMRPGMYQNAAGQWIWRDPQTGQPHLWSPPK